MRVEWENQDGALKSPSEGGKGEKHGMKRIKTNVLGVFSNACGNR